MVMGNDKIKGKKLKAVFGQEGNDILTGLSQDFGSPTLLSGGAGNDTYIPALCPLPLVLISSVPS
jgi:hypothetical protein